MFNVLNLRVLNAFNQIEGPKAVLLAKLWILGLRLGFSAFSWCFLGEFHAWCFEEKCRGISKVFKSEDHYFSYLSETAIFTAKRSDETYYFEPIRAKDYLSTSSVKAHSIHGEVVTIEPSEEDFKTHRSYQFQDLTIRGTIEFRSVCTQPFSSTLHQQPFTLVF